MSEAIAKLKVNVDCEAVSNSEDSSSAKDRKANVRCCKDLQDEHASDKPDKACEGGSADDECAKKAKSKVSPKKLGERGEDAAARFLKARGYEILERNWKCFAGEADIIALDEDALVFVEVKTRKDVSKGFPSEAVGAKKRERYERIALAYLQNADFVDIRVRFDIISIIPVGEGRAMLRHHINAFGID